MFYFSDQTSAGDSITQQESVSRVCVHLSELEVGKPKTA